MAKDGDVYYRDFIDFLAHLYSVKQRSDGLQAMGSRAGGANEKGNAQDLFFENARLAHHEWRK